MATKKYQQHANLPAAGILYDPLKLIVITQSSWTGESDYVPPWRVNILSNNASILWIDHAAIADVHANVGNAVLTATKVYQITFFDVTLRNFLGSVVLGLGSSRNWLLDWLFVNKFSESWAVKVGRANCTIYITSAKVFLSFLVNFWIWLVGTTCISAGSCCISRYGKSEQSCD